MLHVAAQDRGPSVGVHVGAAQVHSALLQEQRRLMWQTVQSGVELEATASDRLAFLTNLSRMVSQ